MNAENTFEFNSVKYKEFLASFRNSSEEEVSLIVLAGPYHSNRNAALNELKREVYSEPIEIDLSDYISPYEEECYQNLDELFDSIDENASLVIFKKAELLNGVYTSYSSSAVKYGSPQVKYFLNKIENLNTAAVIEYKNLDELDRMVSRKADAVILFKEPSSLIDRLFWKIKNVHVHGSSFLSPRFH